MPVPLYMDVHVPEAITDQLRRRHIDVLTAIEDSADRLPDDELLQRASALRRLMFTQDIRFMALAEQWQKEGREFAGLLFGHQLRGTIGQICARPRANRHCVGSGRMAQHCGAPAPLRPGAGAVGPPGHVKAPAAGGFLGRARLE
jgi:hypothetical protein